MDCPKCRQRLPAAAKFCDACGAAVAPAPPPAGPAAVPRAWVVGADPACDVVVAGSTVSRRHCRLTEAAGGYLLEDLGSTNGTYVDGKRIDSVTRVRRGDRVTLGQTQPLVWPAASTGRQAESIRIGRDADNDVVLDYPAVSGHHARILLSLSGAEIEDLGSTNGTAIGRPDNKVRRGALSAEDVVYFGSLKVPASRLLSGRLALGVRPATVLRLTADSIILGRDPQCGDVLDYPMISWHHARISRSGGQIHVEDLGSTNGTFVNGRRIRGALTIKVGDVIGLGSYTLTLTAHDKLERRDYRDNVAIEARGVTVDVPARRLIEQVSLTVYPGELVGLMGGSGAGKTTFLNALNGYKAPSAGGVLCNGEDLYRSYERFAGHFGYVPQDDIMHRELSVAQALYYTARLRLPADYSEADIRARIALVLEQLNIESCRDVKIGSPEDKGISGGQRKRVNLAMELLTDPSVLFLDEPTSGLSSEDALMVMKLLRGLADAGKTILITIHQPSLDVFRLMDDVIVLWKNPTMQEPGRLVYFGPAYPRSIQFLNEDVRADAHEVSPDLLMRRLPKEKQAGDTRPWAQKYAASQEKKEYVDDRAGQLRGVASAPVTSRLNRRLGLGQWWTFVRRAFAVKRRDRRSTLILLSQAPIIAALIAVVFGELGAKSTQPGRVVPTTLFLLVVAALWFGCSNSAREIVAEWAIYHRERMVNLKIPSYVMSKFTVLGMLCVLQCAMLLMLVYPLCELKASLIPTFMVLCLAALTGLGLGLALSAVSKTSEMAVSLVPLILLPMVILGGLMQPRPNMKPLVKAVTAFVPSRWAFESLMVLETNARDRDRDRDRETARDREEPEEQSQATSRGTRRRLPSLEDMQLAGDIAEPYFPQKGRSTAAGSTSVLVFMPTFLMFATLLTLKARDVH